MTLIAGGWVTEQVHCEPGSALVPLSEEPSPTCFSPSTATTGHKDEQVLSELQSPKVSGVFRPRESHGHGPRWCSGTVRVRTMASFTTDALLQVVSLAQCSPWSSGHWGQWTCGLYHTMRLSCPVPITSTLTQEGRPVMPHELPRGCQALIKIIV